MIAAWLSLTAGWALTHAWSVTAILTVLLVLGVIFIVIPLTREPTGKRNASRPATPRAGKARAWLRKAPRAVRSLPGAIGWAWRTPVRTTTSLPGSSPAGSGAPGLSAAGGVPRSARPGTAELHHEDRDGTATAAWLRTLRGPGWTVLALRRQLAVLGALTSGRVTPGHTAARPHGEPGHPAGDHKPREAGMVAGEIPAQVPVGCTDETPASRSHAPEVWADRNAGRFDSALAGPGSDHTLSGVPGPATLASPPPFLASPPAPRDPAPWQPRAEQTDWSLLAAIAPDLAAERRDAQTQAGA